MALLELDDKLFIDTRFERLGELLGTSKYDARARIEVLWYDSIRSTKPVRTADEIEHLTGWYDSERGSMADLMVRAKLAEQVPGGYKVKGVEERMAWLVELREKRKEAGGRGGRKTAAKARRGKNGRFEGSDVQPNTEHLPGLDESNDKQNEAKPRGPVPGSVPGSGSLPGAGAENEITPPPPAARAKKLYFDFEGLYRAYPRKKGKTRGLKICEKEIKTHEDYRALGMAIRRFTQHHVLEKTEVTYIPYFSTFMGEWRDWLDPETGSTPADPSGRILDPELARIKRELENEKPWEDGHDGPA